MQQRTLRATLVALFAVSELTALGWVFSLTTECSGTSTAEIQCTMACEHDGLIMMLDGVGLGPLAGLLLWRLVRLPGRRPYRFTREFLVGLGWTVALAYLLVLRFVLIGAMARWDVPGCRWMG